VTVDKSAAADQFVKGFLRELEQAKVAAPRWIRELASGKMTTNAAARLMGKVPDKVREIRQLGHGGEQVADLVFHPSHGVVVRKVPLVESAAIPAIRREIGVTKRRMGLWEDLKRITGGKGEFAHIKEQSGRGGLTSYYEYSTPHAREFGPRLPEAYEKARARTDRLFEARDELPRGSAASKAIHLKAMSSDRRQQAIREMMHRQPPLSPETEATLGQLKKTYPRLHDIRPANIVGGKLVDVTPGGEKTLKTIYTEKRPPVPAAAYSKKLFLKKKQDRLS
jgi:hypothetical protein